MKMRYAARDDGNDSAPDEQERHDCDDDGERGEELPYASGVFAFLVRMGHGGFGERRPRYPELGALVPVRGPDIPNGVGLQELLGRR